MSERFKPPQRPAWDFGELGIAMQRFPNARAAYDRGFRLLSYAAAHGLLSMRQGKLVRMVEAAYRQPGDKVVASSETSPGGAFVAGVNFGMAAVELRLNAHGTKPERWTTQVVPAIKEWGIKNFEDLESITDFTYGNNPGFYDFVDNSRHVLELPSAHHPGNVMRGALFALTIADAVETELLAPTIDDKAFNSEVAAFWAEQGTD